MERGANPPPLSSATVSQECIAAYNELKLSKTLKYIVFKLSDNYKEIEVEHTSQDADWEDFRDKLIKATSKSRSVCLLKRNDPSCGRQAPPVMHRHF